MTSSLIGRPRLRAATLAAAGAVALAGLGPGTPAQAVTVQDWERLAHCESSGRWNINTGNGYYGGLQFSASSWAHAGGTRYARRADLATKAQQIATANRLLALQGWGAWPSCTKKLGMRGIPIAFTGATVRSTSSAPAARPAARATRSSSTAAYVVRSGDTLSRIAARLKVSGGWQALWAANRSTVPNANVIRVGQVLRLR